MNTTERLDVTLEFKAEANLPPVVRLRGALKQLWRQYGMRCTRINQIPEVQQVKLPDCYEGCRRG